MPRVSSSAATVACRWLGTATTARSAIPSGSWLTVVKRGTSIPSVLSTSGAPGAGSTTAVTV